MTDQQEPKKQSKQFLVPPLATGKLGPGQASQMTSREEQEQYRLQGIQDGKVDELIQHEKREGRKRKLGQPAPDAEQKKDSDTAGPA